MKSRKEKTRIGMLLPQDSQVKIWVGGKLMYVKVPPGSGGGAK